MSLPLSSSTASAGFSPAPQRAPATVRPLDFMFVASREDFQGEISELATTCKLSGQRCAVLYVEDLPGASEDDKLRHLKQINASWQSKGLIARTTIKVVLLHGSTLSLPATARASAAPHTMSGANDKLSFATEKFDAAMRSISTEAGQRSVGFTDTIIYESCHVGDMRQAFQKTGGSYVLMSGKKSVLVEDAKVCMTDLIRENARRQQENIAPLSGRECWERARQLSGEHVAYVQGDTLEISKAMPAEHAASPAAARPESAQHIYLALAAKLVHGSAAAVRRVFEYWGPDTVRQAIPSQPGHAHALVEKLSLSTRETAEKLALLSQYGFGLPDAPEQLLDAVCKMLKNGRHPLLVLIFEKSAAGDCALTPAMLLDHLKALPDAQAALVRWCQQYPALNEAFIRFMPSPTASPPLPLAALSADLRHLILAPTLAGLPRWLADEFEDYPELAGALPGQPTGQQVFHAWKALLLQKRYTDAGDFLAVASMHLQDELGRVLQEGLPALFDDAVAMRNLKLTRMLITLDHERALDVKLASRLQTRAAADDADEALRAFASAVLPQE